MGFLIDLPGGAMAGDQIRMPKTTENLPSPTESALRKHFPEASADEIECLTSVYDNVLSSIMTRMMEIFEANSEPIHINLREEMALELARLSMFLADRIIEVRVDGRCLGEIDEALEREECFDQTGRQRIENTAQTFAHGLLLKKYQERWKPKTIAALEREMHPENKPLAVKPVEDNHYIPHSFIKRYWSKDGFIYVHRRDESGKDPKRLGTGQWGFTKNLYSDWLEAYFTLIEGDAVRPLEMILRTEPLNGPQREALVGFIVIQKLRNPHFMSFLARAVKPEVAAHPKGRPDDPEYMKLVYESIYGNNEFYDQLARPVYWNRWVIVHSTEPIFVLPDTCNIFGTFLGEQYVFMPLTPTDCLVVLPVRENKIRIVPYTVHDDIGLNYGIACCLIFAARDEFLSVPSIESRPTEEEGGSELIQRILKRLVRITDEAPD